MTCLHLQRMSQTDRECSKDTRRSWLLCVPPRCTQCHALFPPPVMEKESFQYPLSKKSGYFISCGKTPFPLSLNSLRLSGSWLGPWACHRQARPAPVVRAVTCLSSSVGDAVGAQGELSWPGCPAGITTTCPRGVNQGGDKGVEGEQTEGLMWLTHPGNNL